jgi:hypothetical protein
MRTRSLPSGLIGVVVLTLATCGVGSLAADEPASFTLKNGLRVRLVPPKGEERVWADPQGPGSIRATSTPINNWRRARITWRKS